GTRSLPPATAACMRRRWRSSKAEIATQRSCSGLTRASILFRLYLAPWMAGSGLAMTTEKHCLMPHRRQDEAIDPVAHFGETHILAHDVVVDAEQPGDVLAARVLVKDFQQVDVFLRRLGILEETERDQLGDAAIGEPRQFVQVVFGVILQAPELP